MHQVKSQIYTHAQLLKTLKRAFRLLCLPHSEFHPVSVRKKIADLRIYNINYKLAFNEC